MLPVHCQGCHKAEVVDMEGLHPFITGWSRCTVYPITSWITRRGGCAFNATTTVAPKAKLNPLKASKRGL